MTKWQFKWFPRSIRNTEHDCSGSVKESGDVVMGKNALKVAACIVTYNNPINEVKRAVTSFLNCTLPVYLIIVDNNSASGYFDQLKVSFKAKIIQSGINNGYGFGHNIGIKNVPECEYYLILNPDIEIPVNTIEQLVKFMDNNPDIGLVAPKILNEDGSIQYLNKRFPSVFDLLARRFLPKRIQSIMFIKQRMDKYIMLDKGYDVIQDVSFISGCFMFLRKNVLDKVGGFDERYFLYFEDADLSKRVQLTGYRTVYYPHCAVTHIWKRASHNSFKMTYVFIVNGVKYFNKWGWKLF